MDTNQSTLVHAIVQQLSKTGTAKINSDYSIKSSIYAGEYQVVDITGEKYPLKDGLTAIQAVLAAIVLVC